MDTDFPFRANKLPWCVITDQIIGDPQAEEGPKLWLTAVLGWPKTHVWIKQSARERAAFQRVRHSSVLHIHNR